MSEEEEAIVETEAVAEVETEDETEQQTDPGLVEKARSMGWVPPEEFKGDPNKCISAEEFVERGEQVIGFIKKDRDRAEAEVRELKDRLQGIETDYAKRLERIERVNAVALEQQRENLERQYSARKEQAVEFGDVEAYRKLEEEQRAALSELEKKAAEEPESTDDKDALPPQIKQTVEGWVADNRWFTADAEMRAVASTHHEKLMSDKPGLTLEENLAEVREYVKRRYPEKFSNGSGGERRGSPVESGGRGDGPVSKSLWARVPKEDRSVAEKALKDGAFIRDDSGKPYENDTQRREAWARVYFGE
jgi:hypothetical protein